MGERERKRGKEWEGEKEKEKQSEIESVREKALAQILAQGHRHCARKWATT